MIKGSAPRRCLAILAGKGGNPTTKGSTLVRRLFVLAGGGRGPFVGESAPRRLAILAGGVGGPSTKGSVPRRCLTVLADKGGSPTTKGSVSGRPGRPCWQGVGSAQCLRGARTSWPAEDGNPTNRESVMFRAVALPPIT